jgi:hypothetical protein
MQNIADWFQTHLPVATDRFKMLASGDWDGFTGHVSGGWKTFKANAMQNIADWFQTHLPVATDRFKMLASGDWDGFKDHIKGGWQNLKSGALQNMADWWQTHLPKAADTFKNKVIRSFELARTGVALAWNGLRSAVQGPLNWVITNAYNNGVRVLWNHVARKVNLPTLDTMDTIGGGGSGPSGAQQRARRGLARGGVLPGKSTWRQGDNRLVPMRDGEGVAISEAMEIPQLRGELLRWNEIGVKKGRSALRDYAQQGFSNGGVSSLKKRGQFLEKTPQEGFSLGGILSTIGNKVSESWDAIQGRLSDWASGPLDGLVNATGSEFGRGETFRGLPYHALKKLVSGIKGIFSDKDAEYAASLVGGNWTGATGSLQAAVNFAKSQHGKRYQWGGDGNPSWDCSGYLSAIESVIRGQRPHRRWSTHAFGSRGPSGWERNLDSPFTIGITHSGVGHTAGTLMGTNVESSSSAGVRYGGGARGAGHSMFTARYGLHNAIPLARQGGRIRWFRQHDDDVVLGHVPAHGEREADAWFRYRVLCDPAGVEAESLRWWKVRYRVRGRPGSQLLRLPQAPPEGASRPRRAHDGAVDRSPVERRQRFVLRPAEGNRSDAVRLHQLERAVLSRKGDERVRDRWRSRFGFP